MVEVDIHRVERVTILRHKFAGSSPGARAFDVVSLRIESEDDVLLLKLYVEAGAKVGLADDD